MSSVVHFEIHAEDVQRAVDFYVAAFGWRTEDWSEFTGSPYIGVHTRAEGEPGINGGLGGAANEFKGTVNTVGVDDIDAVLKKVIENGGQIVMPRDEIPGVGLLAYVREPGGAVIGLMQSFPGSGM